MIRLTPREWAMHLVEGGLMVAFVYAVVYWLW